MSLTGFFSELKRRRVLQVGGAYVAGAWLGVEVFDFLLEQFGAPDWTYRLLGIALVVGFPIAMILAWVIQVQEDGAWAVDPERGDYKTIAAAAFLGAAITALLSWWIIWANPPGPAFKPMPNSMAVLPIDGAENFHAALVVGLESSNELTLVRLGSIEAPDDLQEFGKQHDLEWLSLGRVARQANETFVELQLFNTRDGEVAWSREFDLRGLPSREAITRVTNALLESLGVAAVQPQDIARTDHNGAFHKFIEGEQQSQTYDLESLDRATAAFEQALEIDPGYAQALVRLADTLYERAQHPATADEDRQRFVERAKTIGRRAYVLNPGSGAALSLVGMAESMRQIRIQAYEQALVLDPDHDRSYFRLAQEHKESDNLEYAENLIARAIRLRPASAIYAAELADIQKRRGRSVESEAERQ